MPDIKFQEIWSELLEFIPKMRSIVREALRKDHVYTVHGTTIQGLEREQLRSNLDMLRKKWLVDILYFVRISKNPYFADIQKNLPGINSRTLTDRLQELEELGMINRIVKTGKPIRVYYELTDFGLGIYELLIPLNLFILDNLHQLDDVK
jgi:DNA-binding HxlR family transcriptional regulator